MTDLTRRYRRLLRAYPAAYRDERGEELLGTLLDGARPDQRRPTLAQAADIVVSGLLCRLRFGYVRRLSAGAAIAATVALAIAGGLGTYYALLGDLVFAVWPLAAGAAAAHPRRGRFAIGVAVLTGLAWATISSGNSQLAMVTTLSFGVLALLGWQPRASAPARAAVVLGAAAVAAGTYAIGEAFPYGEYAARAIPGLPVPGMLDPGDPPYDPWAGALVLLAVLVGLALVAAARRGPWSWAAVLVLAPAGPQAHLALQLVDAGGAPPAWSTTTWLLLAALTAGATAAIWWAGQHPGLPSRAPGPDRLLGAAATAALAGAAGLSVTIWTGQDHYGWPIDGLGFVLAALLYPLAGRRLALPATILAAGAWLFIGSRPDLVVLVPLLVLGILAVTAMTGTATRPRPAFMAAGMVAVAGIGLLITGGAAGDHATVHSALAALPVAIAAVAAGLSLRQPGRHRLPALVLVALAGATLIAVTPAFLTTYAVAILLGATAALVLLAAAAARVLTSIRSSAGSGSGGTIRP